MKGFIIPTFTQCCKSFKIRLIGNERVAHCFYHFFSRFITHQSTWYYQGLITFYLY